MLGILLPPKPDGAVAGVWPCEGSDGGRGEELKQKLTLRIASLKMDREWSLLHANPLLPEFNLPTKEERHMQNRTVQLRAEYRKRDDRSLSPTPN